MCCELRAPDCVSRTACPGLRVPDYASRNTLIGAPAATVHKICSADQWSHGVKHEKRKEQKKELEFEVRILRDQHVCHQQKDEGCQHESIG